jgi:hypothetical protein
MELSQIKEKRDILEKEIFDLIRKFQDETDVYLKTDGIGFNYIEIPGSDHSKIITGVYVKLEI